MDDENEELSLVDSIKEKLDGLSCLSNECCIYKVPERLRRLNPDAYTPRVVSIGPLHHGEEKLEDMEDHKLRYLKCLIPKTCLSLEGMVEVARETWEARARLCYAQDFKEMRSNEFVKMLIVDAGFLVELLLRSSSDVDSCRIYWRQKMIVDVNHDIMLLANQLPYFVVKEMFGFLHGDHRPLSPIIHNHFKKFWMSIPQFSKTISDAHTSHFVDLLRSTYLPSVLDFPPPRGSINDNMRMTDSALLSAKEIQNAGVKLRPAEDISTSPLDITFANGVLTIPQIKISDITEALYRNIILFEQCHRLDTYFSDYMMFLSCFVRSPASAELFIDHGIIVNRRGNAEDVSKLFDRVLKETTQTGYTTFYYQAVYDHLQAHCNTPWNKWHATLTRDYFNNPWSVASVLAALLLLLLSFIQTVCSILAL